MLNFEKRNVSDINKKCVHAFINISDNFIKEPSDKVDIMEIIPLTNGSIVFRAIDKTDNGKIKTDDIIMDEKICKYVTGVESKIDSLRKPHKYYNCEEKWINLAMIHFKAGLFHLYEKGLITSVEDTSFVEKDVRKFLTEVYRNRH